jgi:release factor glutamine methyltransferase
VVAVRRLPRKSLGLSLLSLAYLQVGFRSAFFLIRPLPVETVAPAEQGAKDLIQAGRF